MAEYYENEQEGQDDAAWFYKYGEHLFNDRRTELSKPVKKAADALKNQGKLGLEKPKKMTAAEKRAAQKRMGKWG